MEVISVVETQVEVRPGCSRDGLISGGGGGFGRAKLEIGNGEIISEEDPTIRSEDSTESSSIGQPDDDEDEVTDNDEDEVQSTLSSLASLEDSLPIKRGLSKFYTGKSKSFANLTEVRNLKELGKSENPFNKRRRTSMAYNLMFKSSDDSNNNNHSKKKKSGLFYSHSNYISMPLLPLTEDEDEDGVVDDSSDADDYYSPASRLQQIKEHSYDPC